MTFVVINKYKKYNIFFIFLYDKNKLSPLDRVGAFKESSNAI